ncbi:MAG: TIM barrel protein [Phycisphaerales bacterium]|nr:TIM barrel protein [Phycisphaerales bacterium]
MDRRTFIAAASTAGLTGAAAAQGLPSTLPDPGRHADPKIRRTTDSGAPFTLDYAPHFGMFHAHAGDDVVDQINFMADAGFRSIEDNWMRGRPVAEQERIASALRDHNMRMGVFVANNGGFGPPLLTSGDAGAREQFLRDIRESVDIADRTGAIWATSIPGNMDTSKSMAEQTRNVIDGYKAAADILDGTNLILVCEPLNPRDHAGQWLVTTDQSLELMKAVNSPNVRILQDIYHQQASEGNLIENIDRIWDWMPYVQVGDNPGRKEPGTGEIHYANVFKHLHQRGYTGIVGMEHGKSRGGKDGEIALIEAYRAVDPTA